MSVRVAAVAALLALARRASGQTIVVGGQTVAANSSTLGPAAALVDASSTNATAKLFPAETIQLTDAVLANLTSLKLTNASWFSFQTSSNAADNAKVAAAACKTYEGDPLWPAPAGWAVVDALVGGTLVKTVPFASVCYDDFGNYDAAKCAYITANWSSNSSIHIEDPTSVNALQFEGLTCQPPTLNPGETNCTVGGFPAYVVEAVNVAQVQLAVNVARNLNLRLVIKNTGHDFGAKSVGKGALSIWTHKFTGIEFFGDYTEGTYGGPAFKLGTGLTTTEVFQAAKDNNVTVVGGEGRTVGVMGGWVQGGGHSPISPWYGMGADQVLSMEVVTADGRFVTASNTSNPGLFWALRGGGGSTYGVATSVVIKAHPQMPFTVMSLTVINGNGTTGDTFWQAMRLYFDNFVSYAVDHKTYGYIHIFPIGNDTYMLDLQPWFAPNMTTAELQALAAPMFANWTALGLAVEPQYQTFDNYYDAWWAGFPLETWDNSDGRTASRLFPRSNFDDPAKLNATFAAVKSVVEEGGFVISFNIHASPLGGYPDTAVNPAWRDTVYHCIVATQYPPGGDEAAKKAASDKLTFDWMARLRAASPGSGAYMSESDYIEPDFTQAFWGAKYARALALKRRLDPYDVFYAQNAVGSEFWQMSENIFGNLPSQDSRLCRKPAGAPGP